VAVTTPEEGGVTATPRVIMHSRHNDAGVFLSATPEVTELLGYQPAELVGTSGYEYIHPGDLPEVAARHAQLLAAPGSVDVAYRVRHREGRYISVRSTSVVHTVPGGLEIHTVTVPSAARPPASGPADDFAAFSQGSSALVGVVDPDAARVTHANRALEEAVGAEPGTLSGASFFGLIDPEALPALVASLSRLLHSPRGTITVRCRLWRRGRVGEPPGPGVPATLIIHDLTHDPVVAGFLVVGHPLTPSSAAAPVALRAPKVAVIDRSTLHQILTERLTEPGAAAGLGLAILHLEELDSVVAALGARATEALHRKAARLLARVVALHPPHRITNLGVGRFAVLVEGLATLEEARAFGDLLRDSVAMPFDLAGEEVFVSTRVALALAQEGTSADGLLAAAQHVLARSEGGPRVVAFHATPGDLASANLRLRAELYRAVERDQLELRFQPLVELRSERVQGAEALVRWRHPERGLLPPGEFLHLAETSDFIRPLGRWVLEAALHRLAQWRSAGGRPDAFVAVNVSANQLLDARFPETVADALVISGQPAAALSLEITETAVLEPSTRVTSVLEQLVALGVRLAIDDFGTGQASLTYLKRIPADSIKIDSSFVNGLSNSGAEDTAIVAATIAMAHALGRTATAEGVETTQQLSALRELGCDHAQGYLFSPPVEAAEVEAMLRAGKLPPRRGAERPLGTGQAAR
jgi:PAS domain S-box-containing protein